MNNNISIKNKKSFLAIGYDDTFNFDYENELKKYCHHNNSKKTSYDLEQALVSWLKKEKPDFISLSSGIDSNLLLSLHLQHLPKKPVILHFGSYGTTGSEYKLVEQIVKKLNLENILTPIREYTLKENLSFFIKNNIYDVVDNLVAFDSLFKEASLKYQGGKIAFMQGADTIAFDNPYMNYNYFSDILQYSPIKRKYAKIFKHGPIWSSYERFHHSYYFFKEKGYTQEAKMISEYYYKIQNYFLSNFKNRLEAMLFADIHLVRMLHFQTVRKIANKYNFELISPFYDLDVASIIINSLTWHNIINPNKNIIYNVFKKNKKHDFFQFGKGANISYKKFSFLDFNFELKKYYLDLD